MLTDEHELPVILEEMEDRFGAVPQEARNLAGLVSIKLMLGRENVVRLDRALSGGSHRIIITFSPDGPRNPEAVIAAVSSRKKWKLLPDNRLVIEIAGATEPEAVIAAVKNGIMTLRDAQG
jgi:transcription-repair coupling factor (superfamily II helicase)